jgi:hypothetical protein
VVTDSFGVRTLLRPIGDWRLPSANWSMWQPEFMRYPGETPFPSPMSNLFFLPPTAGRVLDGPDLEEVLLARDEMANMAWAVERSIEGRPSRPRSVTPEPRRHRPRMTPASRSAAPAQAAKCPSRS